MLELQLELLLQTPVLFLPVLPFFPAARLLAVLVFATPLLIPLSGFRSPDFVPFSFGPFVGLVLLLCLSATASAMGYFASRQIQRNRWPAAVTVVSSGSAVRMPILAIVFSVLFFLTMDAWASGYIRGTLFFMLFVAACGAVVITYYRALARLMGFVQYANR